jgi:flagellar biosynthetic protein FlhB
MADAADRSLPASPRRREAARRQGALPTASGPAWAVTAIVGVALAPSWARATLPAAAEMLRCCLAAAAAGRSLDLSLALPAAVLLPTVGVVLAAGGAGLAVRLLCDGPAWHPARLVPDLARLDPLAGLGRVFSRRSLAAAVGGCLGLCCLVAVASWVAGPLVGLVTSGDAFGGGEPLLAAAGSALVRLAVAAAAVTLCQWALARRRFEARIRMTPAEAADEARAETAAARIVFARRERRRQPTAGAA